MVGAYTVKLLLYDLHVDVRNGQLTPVQGTGQKVGFPADEPLRLECQAFLSAMASRQPPLTDGVSGVQVLKVLQVAQRSLVTNGEPVCLPLEGVVPSMAAL